jgi:hypothetical protein
MARPQTHHPLATGISLALGTHRNSLSTIARVSIALMTAVSFAANANTYVVNTNLDPGRDGTLSLRQAILSANGADGNVIQFDDSLNGSTVTLQQGTLDVSSGTDINANGQNITINGNNASAIFSVRATGNTSMEGLTLINGSSGAGGAILSAGTLRLSNMVVTANRTNGSGNGSVSGGGGIFVHGGTLLLSDSKITGNDTTGSGGAIRITNGSGATLMRCRIDHNTANYYGGGISVDSGSSLTLQQSAVDGTKSIHSGSVVNGNGGGIAVFSAAGGGVVISNSTITNNYALMGGAGVALQGITSGSGDSFRFVTITGNRSGTPGNEGNGIADSDGAATLFATIVANNTDVNGTRNDLAGSFVADESLILTPGDAVLSGTGSIVGVDPQLGTFADHGGSTWTMIPAGGSPVVDVVTQSFVEAIDQRGYARPIGLAGDIGAVERQTAEDIIFKDAFEF